MINLGKFDDGIQTEYFQGIGYLFNCVLFNDDGQRVKLKFGTIDELTLVDDILEWVHTGTLTLKNPFDAIERSNKVYTEDGYVDMPNFQFRGDGRDYIYLHIEPLMDKDELLNISSNNYYTIKMVFSIYNIEDISDGVPENKKKKLHFWDYRYQYMLERNLRWSTAQYLRDFDESGTLNISALSNDERSIPTGAAIQNLLGHAFSEQFTDVSFAENWNTGTSKLMYSSPAQYKIADDINYLLNSHVGNAETGELPCILRLERQFGHMWSLLSLSDYFDRSTIDGKFPGPFQYERFIITFLPSNANVIPNRPKAPESTAGDGVTNIHLENMSYIEDYEFSQFTGLSNQSHLTTSCVNGYDVAKKKFIVYQYGIDKVQQDMQTNLADKLYTVGGTKPKIDLLLNQTKLNNLNIYNAQRTAYSREEAIAYGRNAAIRKALYTGNTIGFRCMGNTHRRAGRFIGVDRSNAYDENKFDDKLLGQYMTVNVLHHFSPNQYYNSILGVKPFSSKDLEYRTDGK